MRNLINLSVREYLFKALLPCVWITIPAVAFSLVLKAFLPKCLIWAIGVAVLSAIGVLILSYFLGLTKSERLFVNDKIAALTKKIKR